MNKVGFVCLFVAVVCVAKLNAAAAAFSEAQKVQIQTKLLQTGLECMGDYPLKLDHITTFRKRQLPDDEGAKCFVACMYKKLGLMNSHGKLSEKGAKKSAKQLFKEGDEIMGKIDDLFAKCIHVNEEETSDGEKGCERAALAFNCFIEHAPSLGLDVDF